MSKSPTASKHETTKLENSTYNILMALGIEASFLLIHMLKTLGKTIEHTWLKYGTK